MSDQQEEPKTCPVCGSLVLKPQYKDGISTYRCDHGHVFVVKNKAS